MDQYNFDLLEGMEPMIFVPSGTPVGLDPTCGMRTGLICMTGEIPVFQTMNRSRIMNEILGGNIVLKFFGCGCAATDGCVSGRTVFG